MPYALEVSILLELYLLFISPIFEAKPELSFAYLSDQKPYIYFDSEAVLSRQN